MFLFAAGTVLALTPNQAVAQQPKASVAVLHIDTRGLGYEPDAMGHLVRLELEKLNTYEVIDPVSYTQTWTGQMPMRKSSEQIYEYACHEGNHSVPNILGGAREIERAGRKQPVVTRGIGRLDRPAAQ